MSKVNDLTGQIVAGVVVLGKSTSTGGSGGVKARWMCLCRCGAPFVRPADYLRTTEKKGGIAVCGLCPDTREAKSRGGFGGSQARELGAKDAPLLEAVRKSPCHWCGADKAPHAKDAGNRITKLDWTKEWSERNMIAECGWCQRNRGFRPAKMFLDWVGQIAERHRKEETDWE